MDLIAIIRKQMDVLPNGPYMDGLRSVLRHIEVGFNHLARGSDQADDSAFTDAIYRTNQAFEGSIKEAYRVLAERDPSHVRPFDIEKYLEQNGVFRSRVLTQFTNYRTQWRNPSAHDYKLDFDEDEAFLALVSVSAFAKMLIDQIAERTAFVAVQADQGVLSSTKVKRASKSTKHSKKREKKSGIPSLEAAVLDFWSEYGGSDSAVILKSPSQVVGALGGYISQHPTWGVHFEEEASKRSLSVDIVVALDANVYAFIKVLRWREDAEVEELASKAISDLAVRLTERANEKGYGFIVLYLEGATKYELIHTKIPKRHPVSVFRPVNK